MHGDMLSHFLEVNVIAISVLGGLAVMTFAWIARDHGPIPY